MLRACAIPYLKKLSDSVIVSSQIRIFGMGESAVEDRLHDMMETMLNPTVAPYAKEGEVMLRVTAKSESEEQARAKLVPVVGRIREILGNVVYGVDVDSLEQVAVTLLNEKKLTLAVAESCTGGMVSKRITDIPGASGMFKGGVCAYANEIKANMLGVDSAVIARCGAVSAEVARAMAQGVRSKMHADIGVGITGIAGPSGGDGNKPVGLVYVAVDCGGEIECRELKLGTDRGRIRIQASNHALDMVRRHVLGITE
jgi:nicotinamide-nucleotide amidase